MRNEEMIERYMRYEEMIEVISRDGGVIEE